MAHKFTVISNTREEAPTYRVLRREDPLRHFRNVTGSVLQNALETWRDLWQELQGGTVTPDALATPEAVKGFVPRCGWPEFLEKMGLLEHYLDSAKKFCEGE